MTGRVMYGDDALEALEAVREAEYSVYLTQWRAWEELALQWLAVTPGLAYAPLVPGSDVIHLVSYDGLHLGHVRREWPHGPRGGWIAVPVKRARLAGCYRTARAAARALARASGW